MDSWKEIRNAVGEEGKEGKEKGNFAVIIDNYSVHQKHRATIPN